MGGVIVASRKERITILRLLLTALGVPVIFLSISCGVSSTDTGTDILSPGSESDNTNQTPSDSEAPQPGEDIVDQIPVEDGGTGESAVLPFSPFRIKDKETGTVWNIKGEAESGPLKGARFEQIAAYSAYWFAWASFWQGTQIWSSDGTSSENLVFREVSPGEIFQDLPKDASPPLDSPLFLNADESFGLFDDDIILGVAINGDAKAYPIRIMNWHEIVNHSVGGQKISVTYCPLTASGVNFDASETEFGNTGALFNNNVVIYDRENRDYWTQMGFTNLTGSMGEKELTMLPIVQTTWGMWRKLYPDTEVLSFDTGYRRNYDVDRYVEAGYTVQEVVWFRQFAPIDRRLNLKEMVLGLVDKEAEIARAYPYSNMGNQAAINDNFVGRDVLILYKGSGLLAIAYERSVSGITLTFDIIPNI